MFEAEIGLLFGLSLGFVFGMIFQFARPNNKLIKVMIKKKA
jgi:hypothetical protein